jgi:hypothetical protein
MTDPEDKGFTVKDRRFQQSEEEKNAGEESRQREAVKGLRPERTKPPTLPDLRLRAGNYLCIVSHVFSTSVFHLEIAPETGASENLPAKQTIDFRAFGKTRNNHPEESM